MIITKHIAFSRIVRWSGRPLFFLLAWSTFAVCFYQYSGMQVCLQIPWLPLSLIGTAVAFYVGFKNNSAYDRLWEARKIWGGIVNTSRTWGISCRGFVSNQFRNQPASEQEIADVCKRLIYRHIAWLYALRSQLLVVKSWEHAAQGGITGRTAATYQNKFGVGLYEDEVTKKELTDCLAKEELERTIAFQNTATQLLDRQSMELKSLREQDLIDDFRHMELQRMLETFFTHQGKCERIKNYPLPRQYANSSSIFVYIFLFLLPFAMACEFEKLSDYGVWWSIPFSALVGWVFYMMESVGDYSENPFQGMANDIPMLALCRTIEIDLREMLGEADIPEPIQAKQGVLM